MIKGFKDFISNGNVLDLAVAVIIGAAFKPIVDAITNVIMGVIGALLAVPFAAAALLLHREVFLRRQDAR